MTDGLLLRVRILPQIIIVISDIETYVLLCRYLGLRTKDPLRVDGSARAAKGLPPKKKK